MAPPISKVLGNLYAATNTDTTDYGSGQIWCDNDIIIQDSTTTDTRNVKTLGANLTVTAGNALILASTGNTTINANTGTSAVNVNSGSGGITLTNSGSISVAVSGANITLTSGGAGTLNLASFANMNATGSAGTTNISNATTTVQGTMALNIGNDANTGTITVGSANKTLSIAAGTTNISGNLNITGTTTTLNSTNTTFQDNVITLHAMPTGTADSVVLYQRYPADVVTENLNTYTLTCTSASSGTSLTCSSLGTATVATILYSFFVNNGNYLYITAATGTGPWTLTLSQAISAATGTSVTAYSRVSAGLLYTENASTKGFNLAYYSAIGEEAGQFSINSQPAYADLCCNNIYASGTISGAGSAGPTHSRSRSCPINDSCDFAIDLCRHHDLGIVHDRHHSCGDRQCDRHLHDLQEFGDSGVRERVPSATSGTLGAGPFEELCISWPASDSATGVPLDGGIADIDHCCLHVRVLSN